jgi:hypothetical protein
MMRGFCGIEYISPLQGFDSCCKKRWTLSIAKILSAYSAIIALCHLGLKGLHIKKQDNVLFINTKQLCALKRPHIKGQDKVLFINTKQLCALKGPHIKVLISETNDGNDTFYHYALKGHHIIGQDNVLFNKNIAIISPERA